MEHFGADFGALWSGFWSTLERFGAHDWRSKALQNPSIYVHFGACPSIGALFCFLEHFFGALWSTLEHSLEHFGELWDAPTCSKVLLQSFDCAPKSRTRSKVFIVLQSAPKCAPTRSNALQSPAPTRSNALQHAPTRSINNL